MVQMRDLLEPSLAFIAASDKAGEDDVRIMWDVRIIRGKSDMFGHINGTATMSGLLADSQLHMASDRIDTEMLTKVVVPVVTLFQDLINKKALELPEGDTSGPLAPMPYPTGLPLAKDEDLAAEAEILSQQ